MVKGNLHLSEGEQQRILRARKLVSKESAGIATLVGMLTDESWIVRREVVMALASLGDSAIPTLVDGLQNARDNEARIAALVDALSQSVGEADKAALGLLTHSDPAVVTDAIQILGRRKFSPALPALISLTESSDDVVAVGALEALGRIGGRAAVEALVKIIEGGNFFRVFPAIDILGRSGDRRVVEPLARLLKNPIYLPEAVRALGRTGERAAAKPLAELLRMGSDASVRLAAIALWELREKFAEKAGDDLSEFDKALKAEATGEIVRKLARVLAELQGSEATATCHVLGILGRSEASAALAQKLDESGPVSEAAAQALKTIGDSSESHLLGALREGDSTRRRILLPLVSRAASTDDILSCLRDPDPEVRALACDALARAGATSLVSEIFKLLEDKNLRVVHAATSALQALGTREARTLSAAAATSPSAVVRRAALRILSYYGDESSLEIILRGLDDSDARVREVALQGLPLLEDPKALAALIASAKSSDDRTRALAMRALGQLPPGDIRPVSLLIGALKDNDAWVRYYAIQSLGRLGSADAAADIAACLNDSAGQVRVSAVEALSHLDSPVAHKALVSAATSTEGDVQRAGIVGLGIAHRPEDMATVLSAATGSDVATRLIALSALVSFASPEVVPALAAAAQDEDEQVRQSAIGFLAAREEKEATESLVKLLSDARSKVIAREALSMPFGGRVEGILSALLSSGDELSGALVSILVRSQEISAKTAIFSVMTNPNIAARRAAISAIAAGRDPARVQMLESTASQDADEGVREIARLLLNE